MAVWKKAAENGKGHGGIMVLVRKKKGRFIQLEREDSNKQFIWFKISENGNTIRIAACYFPPQVSKTYKSRGFDHKYPFCSLKKRYCSEVLIVGDFNARTTSEQANIFCCKKDCNLIWLTEEGNHQWTRVSEDNKSCNRFGEKLLTLCGAFDLVICNGLARWANSSNFTSNTYNGASVVDYAICSHGLCEKMEEVLIGEQLWELKSDHRPIYLSFIWAEQQQRGTKNQCIQQPPSKGKIILTQKNYTFKIALERLFNKEKILSQGLHSLELTKLIQNTLT
jgi:exonuclease III